MPFPSRVADFRCQLTNGVDALELSKNLKGHDDTSQVSMKNTKKNHLKRKEEKTYIIGKLQHEIEQ